MMIALLFSNRHQSQQSSPQFWSQLGLSSCHALRTIRFTLVIHSSQSLARMWRHIIDILSTVPKFSLTKVAFTLTPDTSSLPEAGTDGFPWDALESALIRCCRDAAEVAFVVVKEKEASFRHKFLPKLPRVDQKCVVLFKHSEIQ